MSPNCWGAYACTSLEQGSCAWPSNRDPSALFGMSNSAKIVPCRLQCCHGVGVGGDRLARRKATYGFTGIPNGGRGVKRCQSNHR
jgi:hypothetical protein